MNMLKMTKSFNLILFSMFILSTTYAQEFDIKWQDLKGVTVDQSQKSLTGNGTEGWDNMGAASMNYLISEENGYISFTSVDDGNTKAIGFSAGNIDHDYQSIEYGLFLDEYNEVWVVENGLFQVNLGPFDGNTVFRILREEDLVKYELDGMILYESSVISTGTLLIDLAIQEPNTGFYNMQASFLATEFVYYKSLTDLDYNSNDQSIRKLGTSSSWGMSGSSSYNYLYDDQNGYVLFSAQTQSKERAVGLSSSDVDYHYNSIEYGVLLNSSDEVEIIESGSSVYNHGTFQDGDLIKIERDLNGDFKYYINNELIYTSYAGELGFKVLDIAFKDQDASIDFIKASFIPRLFTIQTENEIGMTVQLSGASVNLNFPQNGNEQLIEPVFSNDVESIELLYSKVDLSHQLKIKFDLNKVDNSISNVEYFFVDQNSIVSLGELGLLNKTVLLNSPLISFGVSNVIHGGIFSPQNWTHTKSFDQGGNLVGEARQYLDLLGRETQLMAREMESDEYISTMDLYDDFGRKVISTLPASVGNSPKYRTNFMEAQGSNSPYDESNYHYNGKLNNPDPIKSSTAYTLGHYYSDNGEENIAQSQYPYSRFFYSADFSSTPIKMAKPGDEMRMGKGRETRTFKQYTSNELNSVFGNEDYRVKQSSSDALESQAITGLGNISAVKEVVITSDGFIGIRYKASGRVVATCRSGLSSSCAKISATKKLLAEGSRTADIHVPASCSSDVKIEFPSYIVNSVTYTVGLHEVDIVLTNLETQEIIPSAQYTINSNGELTFSLPAYAPEFLRVNFNYKESKLTYFDINNVTPPDLTLSYKLDYSYWTLNFYDLAGKLRKTISPQGSDCSGNSHNHLVAHKYTYDKHGLVIASQKPDEGLIENVYDDYHRLRFSQNAEQRAQGNFTYVLYDEFGKIHQSGEYNYAGGTANAYQFQGNYLSAPLNGNNVSTNTVINSYLSFNSSDIRFWTKNYYHELEAIMEVNSPASLYSYKSNFTPRYTVGKLARTENDQVIKWFSYDQLGQIEWQVQQYLDPVHGALPIDSRIKTFNYTYNSKGQLTNEHYQLYDATENTENDISYDATGRVTTGIFKRNNVIVAKNANEYTQLGALKRRILGNNLQGLDYIYTLDGKLKAINHPTLNTSLDPGKDGTVNSAVSNEDLFGMAIDYYNNDYHSDDATYQSPAMYGSTPGYYDGRIYATRWNNNAGDNQVYRTSGLGGNYSFYTGADDQFMYQYQYDQHLRLKHANLGWFRESDGIYAAQNEYKIGGSNGITYDVIGNITRLERNGYERGLNSGVFSMDDLIYTYANNSSQLITLADNAGNATLDDINVFSSLDDYAYNGNGEMVSSQPDGIDVITYYPNGLTRSITFSNGVVVDYFYDGGGQLVRTSEDPGNGAIKTTLYINGHAIYEQDLAVNSNVNLISYNSMGAVYEVNGSTGVANYQITDNVGHVRLVVNEVPSGGNNYTVVAWADYYPFGRPMPGRKSNISSQRYSTKGSEKAANSRWINYGLRMYSADLGRFTSPDPYGQFYSAYQAFSNDPVAYSDPNGGFVNYGEISDLNRYLTEIMYEAEREQFLYGYSNLMNLYFGIGFSKQMYMTGGPFDLDAYANSFAAAEDYGGGHSYNIPDNSSWSDFNVMELVADIITKGHLDAAFSLTLIETNPDIRRKVKLTSGVIEKLGTQLYNEQKAWRNQITPGQQRKHEQGEMRRLRRALKKSIKNPSLRMQENDVLAFQQHALSGISGGPGMFFDGNEYLSTGPNNSTSPQNQSQQLTSSDYLLMKLYGHFQVGGGEDFIIDATSLDFSITNQRQLNLTNLAKGKTREVNLFNIATGINSISLAFGKLDFTRVSATEFSITSNIFDFDYQSNASNARNAGTILGAFINYNAYTILIGSPGPMLIPIIFGGTFKVVFIGNVTIPR